MKETIGAGAPSAAHDGEPVRARSAPIKVRFTR
jgi:hypothetical protein